MKYLVSLALLSFSFAVQAQNLWREIKVSDVELRADQEVRNLPTEYKMYRLDFEALKSHSERAPSEDLAINIESDHIVTLPMPNGTMKEFRVYDSPTMQEGISAKYPNIRSYKGVAIDNPLQTVRFDFGHNGFHAAVHGPEGVFYIDPYASGNMVDYLTFDVKKDLVTFSEGVPVCGVDHDSEMPVLESKKKSGSRSDIIPLRKYRIAIACTGEYGAWKGSLENAMSDINTGLNRMNQVYENEASIRYILVDNNDTLLHFDAATDPYPNTASGGAMLTVNTNVISQRIGIESYDLGHVYSRSCDVGGIARLGSLCEINSKGAGVTCHYRDDLNFFAVSVTAHEIGHQMSAQHTFNNCDGENESLGNGFEPGSGSTIMSYAGLCGIRNVQPVADDNYHTGSLIQIYNHSRAAIFDDCGEKEDFGNHEPVIQMNELLKTDLFIPDSTYFYLEASATDEDDDNLTYVWDGMNSGPLSLLGQPIGEAPHFKANPPSVSPLRYFPQTQDIYIGAQSRVEVLPAGGLTMLFNFTVRDNNPNGGTAVWEQISFETVSTPGKFGITSPAVQGLSTDMGDEMEIIWDVADTDKAPINCKSVDILFTAETSLDFDINNCVILAEGVPNDGYEKVRLPNVQTNRGRVLVKSRNNIFFDINPFGFQIKEPTEPTLYADAAPLYQKLCTPDITTVEISTAIYGASTGELALSVDDLPAGTVATFDPQIVSAGGSSTLTLDFSNVLATDVYRPVVSVTSDVAEEVFTRTLTLDLVASDFSDLAPTTPADGQSAVVSAPTFEWLPSASASSYDFELSDSPTFENLLLSAYDTEDNSIVSDVVLEKSTVYYWRVRGRNSCTDGDYSKTRAFSTAVLACLEIEASNLPLNISQSGTSTVEAQFNMFSDGSIADVNLKTFKGEHSNNKDLVVNLISPSGTAVNLFNKICSQQNFNCSFDDESNVAVKCPLSQGDTYRPAEPFSAFVGQTSAGTWTLEINDTKSGNGGRLEEATLELCANTSAENPVISNLELLRAPTNFDTPIGRWTMSVTDEDNSDEELFYTVVTEPKIGLLLNSGNVLEVGDRFTQRDINSLNLKYRTTDIEGVDLASFTVIDGTGGWVGILDLNIEVDGAFPVSTEDNNSDESISVFPNPAINSVTVVTDGRQFATVKLVDLTGKLVRSYNTVGNSNVFDLSSIPQGVYMLNFEGKEGNISKKLVIQK